MSSTNGIENVQTRIDFDEELGKSAIVEYSFRDRSSRSQHNIFTVDDKPDKDGLYSYDRGYVREGDWGTDTDGFLKLVAACHAVGYSRSIAGRLTPAERRARDQAIRLVRDNCHPLLSETEGNSLKAKRSSNGYWIIYQDGNPSISYAVRERDGDILCDGFALIGPLPGSVLGD